MMPIINKLTTPPQQLKCTSDSLCFRVSNINVSVINSLRRCILSDLDTVVFKTSPYKENKSNFITNTSQHHNEILKQRLSCIPIHIKNFNDINLNEYIMEVNVSNTTETALMVTTEDFKVKNLSTDQYLDKTQTQEIFPPNIFTNHFIDFVKLNPKISDEIPGEHIHITCEFSISNANDNGMFNIVSTCSYSNTIDQSKVEQQQIIEMEKLKNDGMTQSEINMNINNWKLLDCLRIYIDNSFDFVIQTIGVYSNYDIIENACDYMIYKLQYINNLIKTDKLLYSATNTTLKNGYDIILENEDETLGKVIEYLLYEHYYKNNILSFCGFKKEHPHDANSIIRVAYLQPPIDDTNNDALLKEHLQKCCAIGISIYEEFKNKFVNTYKNDK